MDEGQRPAQLEDPGRLQGLGGLGVFKAGKFRRVQKVILLEDRKRPSQPPRMLRQAAESEMNRPADRSSADSFYVPSGIRARADPSFTKRVHQHAHEEWRPARRGQTGIDERRVSNPTEPRLDKPSDGCSRQRRNANNIG